MAKIKTTHVGSLPRPQEMITKTLRKQQITRDELKHYLSAIIEKQMMLGIDYISNGELPRADYVIETVSRISGFGDTGMAPIPRDLEELPELSRRFGSRNGLITLNPKAPVRLPACSEPLSFVGEALLREELDMMLGVYKSAKNAFPESDSDLFFTSPSPGTVALFMENKHYSSYDEYVENIGKVLRQEYEIISGYGVQLQIDCPDLAMGRHTRYKHLTDDQFIDRIDTNIRALNQSLATIDPEMCRAHICWGNYAGTHHCDIDLSKIYDSIIKINVKFISIESSNHRHAHEWALFAEKTFPDDKVLMPGVIDTSSNTVEHPDLVARRIANFAKIIGPERVIASTDCGFATTASSTSVSGEVAWLKLASLVEGSRRVGRFL